MSVNQPPMTRPPTAATANTASMAVRSGSRFPGQRDHVGDDGLDQDQQAAAAQALDRPRPSAGMLAARPPSDQKGHHRDEALPSPTSRRARRRQAESPAVPVSTYAVFTQSRELKPPSSPAMVGRAVAKTTGREPRSRSRPRPTPPSGTGASPADPSARCTGACVVEPPAPRLPYWSLGRGVFPRGGVGHHGSLGLLAALVESPAASAGSASGRDLRDPQFRSRPHLCRKGRHHGRPSVRVARRRRRNGVRSSRSTSS